MSPFQGPRPIRETAGGQSALTSGPAPAHRRPTRQRPGRCPSTETSADSKAQRPGDQHRRALSCRSCEDSPARHAGCSHYWQPGGPMTVAKLGSNGPMNMASDNALPRMRNHLQCHKSRSCRWRQHQQGERQRQGRSRHNTPLSRTMFRRSPAAEPKPVSTCQAVATRTRPSSPARSTAISLSLRHLSRSRPTCRTTCGTAALVLRHVPQAAAVASKPQPAAYRVRVRAAGADRGLSRGPVVAT